MEAPIPPVALLGRDCEIGLLRDLVVRVAAGHGGAAFVEGEPGIGKSTLVAAGVAAAAELGCRVLWAVADELSQRLPLHPLVECLGPGYAGRSGETDAVDPVPIAVERLLAHIDTLCAAAPVVFVLDDLQWADRPSLQVWWQLSRLTGQMPLLLVATARPTPRRPEILRVRQPAAEAGMLVRLGPLPAAAAVAIARQALAAAAEPLLRSLAARAGGNPLYLREIVEALSRNPPGADADPSAPLPALPASLMEAITDRLTFLSEPTIRMLRMAALLGPEFSVAELATMLGQEPTALVAPVEEAMLAGVLSDAGAVMAFRHPLIHEALYQATPAALRMALHYQAAQALAAMGAAVDQVGRHLVSAKDRVDNWTLDWLAGHAPDLANLAPEITLELLERALEGAPALDPRCGLLATHLVELLFRLDRLSEVVERACQALAARVEPALAVRLTWTRAYAMSKVRRLADSQSVLRAALADPDLAPSAAARLRALYAANQYVGGLEPPGDWTLGECVVAEAQRVGDAFAVSFALHGLSLAAMDTDEAAAVRFIERGLAVLPADPQSAQLRVAMLSNRAELLRSLGRLADARAAVGELVALTGRGAASPAVFTQLLAADLSFDTGDWDDALAGLETLCADLEGYEILNEVAFAHAMWALIAAHRDERATAEAHLAVAPPDTADQFEGSVLYRVGARALLAERAGQPQQALATLSYALQPRADSGIDARHLVAADLVRVALSVGEVELASAATRMIETLADQGPAGLVASRRCRGLLDADPEPLDAAIAHLRTGGAVLLLANTLEDGAAVHALRGDIEAARPMLIEAVRSYRTLGATWDVMRAETRLRPFGIRRTRRGRPVLHRPATGWEALTPTERRVAQMISTRMSNPEIATELFISRRTVQTHVSHILVKLSATSRTEIAALATQR
jgi:DNA-binding CsgD family transcriptional regulator